MSQNVAEPDLQNSVFYLAPLATECSEEDIIAKGDA